MTAQEALDILYDEAACEYEVDKNDGELVALDCTNHDKYLNMREPLQQLIDCQLTKEEIKTIMICLSVACFDEEEYNSIFNKLKQQKEILEEE